MEKNPLDNHTRKVLNNAEILYSVEITPEIAEIAGAFAADGSMQKEHLCMWGHITEDREYYDEVLGPLYEETFGVSLNIHEKRSNSV